MSAPWQTKKHWRTLAHRLAEEGFAVVGFRFAGNGHLHLTVERGGKQGRVTVSGTPSADEHACNVSMQMARRVVR